jgi:SAM-dependent methyltransferase
MHDVTRRAWNAANRLWRACVREDPQPHFCPSEMRQGIAIPPRSLRCRTCGDTFELAEFFFQSGVVEALRLRERLGYREGDFVVDVGCGIGRLAIGMLWELGAACYLGIDVDLQAIGWCQQFISRDHPTYRFERTDVANARYNPDGTIDDDEIKLPVESSSADIVYLNGLFTNLAPQHASIYASEIGRSLRRGGRAFLTAFVEPQSDATTINPEHYVPYECRGPLHVVRYGEEHLFALFDQHELDVTEYRRHGGMFPKQSEIYLRKR